MQKDIQEQLDAFSDKRTVMKNVDGLLMNVKPYLGKIDAEKEWNDDPSEASRMFLHTQSYCDFDDKDALLLLGRTGTGKTSIIRCLCEKVNQGKHDLYDLAVIAQFSEILDSIINSITDFTNPAVSSKLIEIISMYINCHVMKALIKDNPDCADYTNMKNYIQKNGLYDLGDLTYYSGMNAVQRMIDAACKLPGKAGETAQVARTIIDISNAFIENGYEEAYLEMQAAMKNKHILVLIDTLNEYDLQDARMVICVKALIATCFEYYNKSKCTHIHVKISIPSEIHTHLIEQLPGKQQGNTVVIQWKNKDLLKMIAIRMLYCCKNDKKGILKYDGDYVYEDFYGSHSNTTQNAKKFLYNFLPKECPTSLDFYFDTLAYCIRHTLKKPRELMTIFNHLIAVMYEEEDSKYFIKKPNRIRDIIHSTQEELISSALSMYATSYPQISDVCDIVLHGRNCFFQGKDLDDKLKEAAANRLNYDADSIKRILLESGLLGKINEISYMYVDEEESSRNKVPTQDNSIRIITAKFEYQVKGRLAVNRTDYYVLHPMCYEHYECSVGNHTLVYPDQFEDDAEVMKSVRLKDGLSV